MRRRDTPDASVRLASFSTEGKKAGRFRKIAGVSIVDVGCPRSR